MDLETCSVSLTFSHAIVSHQQLILSAKNNCELFRFEHVAWFAVLSDLINLASSFLEVSKGAGDERSIVMRPNHPEYLIGLSSSDSLSNELFNDTLFLYPLCPLRLSLFFLSIKTRCTASRFILLLLLGQTGQL